MPLQIWDLLSEHQQTQQDNEENGDI